MKTLITKLGMISLKFLRNFSGNKFPSKKEDKYLIFNSDLLPILGKILGDPSDRCLYPNTPYKVSEGQRVFFFRRHAASTTFFEVTVEVGKYTCFNPHNQCHYQLKNDFIITVN